MKWAILSLFISCCVLLCGVDGAPTNPLSTFLKNQGLDHLLATFEEQDVTYDMLLELTDPNLRELGLITVGNRLNFKRALVQLQDNEDNNEDNHDDNFEDNQEDNQQDNQQDNLEDNNEDNQHDGNENTEDNGVTFISVKKSTGRVTHHFLDGFLQI